jgi:peptide/nickel transport system permease protein
MLRYVVRRLLFAIPTLLVISLAVFGISKCAPGDPIENAFGDNLETSNDPIESAAIFRHKASMLGIDKPLFYGSIGVAAYPDTLWRIFPLARREHLTRLTAQNGNWPATSAFEAALHQSIQTLERLQDSTRQKDSLRLFLVVLAHENTLANLEKNFSAAERFYQQHTAKSPQMSASMDALRVCTQTLCHDLKPSKLMTPALRWYGLDNQYHHWLVGFLTGNWGLTIKKTQVWQELKPAFFATMAINLMAIFFSYIIAIPLGVEMARRKGGTLDRWAQRLLIFLHAMPVFWLGALLVILFCNPVFGKPLIENPYLDISDRWLMNSEPFLDWFSSKLPKFILPILVLTLYSLTIITAQMRGGMIETLGQDYIRTARAKGVREEDVFWTHAFRNGLFPIITIFASVFPALFTGSLVIETLFNFPGMGQKAQYAFLGHDLAILSAILMASAVMSIVGNLIADLLYALADPRVRFSAEK